MSKRRTDYEKGIERLCDYLLILLQEESKLALEEIKAELESITALRSLGISVNVSPDLTDPNNYFIIIHEDYNRYDDVLPESVEIYVMPGDLDEPKKLDRMFTMNI